MKKKYNSLEELEKDAADAQVCMSDFTLVGEYHTKIYNNGCKPTLYDYDAMWQDGDVFCDKCGRFIRNYDAG